MTVHQRPFAPADAVRLDLSHPAVPVSAVKLTAADDPSRLGAHLDGASPEVRQAAVERSRRVPEPSEVRAACTLCRPPSGTASGRRRCCTPSS